MEQQHAMVKRDGLGAEVERRRETASVAVAAAARARIQAKYLVAMERPRNMHEVRLQVLKECDRPEFAERARYARPQGMKKNEETGKMEKHYVRGWSIRAVEAFVLIMGNVGPETTQLFDDPDLRILQCAIVDYEKNVDWSMQITVAKTKERSKLREGEVPIAKRKNSEGYDVYILPATDEDVLGKQNALVSKTMRTLGLRLIPGDLLDEALVRVNATIARADAADPQAARKRLFDAFAKLGVMPKDISEYFNGLNLDEMTAAHRNELRDLYVLVEEGERWSTILTASPHRPVEDGKAEEKQKISDELREKVANRKKRSAEKKAAKAGGAAPPAEATETPKPDPAPPPPPDGVVDAEIVGEGTGDAPGEEPTS